MSDLVDVVQGAIRGKVKQIIAEEAELAATAIKKRIEREADTLALSVLKFYTVERMEHGILIRVEKGREAR